MMIFQIETVNGYKPHPDFYFRIDEDGKVSYRGRSYVGVVGDKSGLINKQSIREINVLSEFLLNRNQKNHLKSYQNPIFSVEINLRVKSQFKIDKEDVVSEDIVSQIIDLAGVRKWINAELDLYLVMSKRHIRTRELGVLRAGDQEKAKFMYLANRNNQNFKSNNDFIAVQIGTQKPGAILTPVIYFTFSDYRIQERSPTLFLNLGPALDGQMASVFLFISFGKRYNDEKASYILVLGKNKEAASTIFQKAFPHFMDQDFQQVDLEVDYIPNPLFETFIPIAIR